LTEFPPGQNLKVFVTMPAYNAENTVERTLNDLHPSLRENVILVDDASPDDTVASAHRLGIEVVRHDANRGYGGNQKTCYTTALNSGADIVVMLHPDYQYDPRAVPLLVAPLLSGDADMTFGSRFAGVSDPRGGGMPLYRYIGNRVTTVLQNMLLGTRFTEMHSGMRAYTADFLRAIPFMGFRDGFEFDSEMMVAAITHGHRVVEVPIPTRYTLESSSIAVGSSIRYVTHAVGVAARARFARGGRRRRRASAPAKPVPADNELTEKVCVLCGSREWHLRYPRTASGPVDVSEFACTTSAVSIHDDIVDCVRCGLRASVPTIADDEIIQNYKDVVDEEYLSEEAARRETFGWILDRMASYAVGGNELLEFGSNVGLFLSVAKGRDWEATGIEPSRWAVDVGRDRFGVNLEQGIVEDYRADGTADAVVMLDVLEHVTDPMAVLHRIEKLVGPNGMLVLTTVDTRSLHSRLRRGGWPWYIRSHLHYFTHGTLTQMLRRAGFEMAEWSNVPRDFKASYIIHKGGWEDRWWGKAIRSGSRVVDPKIPAGWLGDIKLVVARRRAED
jgi:2-polyprenyl-3-methyl-5-hydroxy-6-metoxy-1,4-benzoquinol methylase